MPTPTDLLRLHLSGLREQLSAEAVSVFATGVLRIDSQPLLVHEGAAAPVAEIADAAAAAAFLAGQPAGAGETRIVAGAAPETWLVLFLGRWCSQPDAVETPSERRRFDATPFEGRCPSVVLGVRAAESAGAPPAPGPRGASASGLPPEWRWALTSAAAMAVQVQRFDEALKDPLTSLAGRSEVLAALEQALRRLESSARPFALLLLNPDDFISVNDRFGREAGDRTLREIADRLRSSCRSSDVPARYGSAIFACVLPDTPREAAREVAERTRARLAEGPFLEGALRLSFSAGVVACDSGSDRPDSAVDVVRRAQQALSRAKRTGGASALWDERAEDEELRTLDRLSGMFTGSLSKDYRNISLLWETVSAMAAAGDFEALAGRIVDRLMSALRPRQVALVDGPSGSLQLVQGRVRRGDASGRAGEPGADLGPDEAGLVAACRRDRKPVRATLPPVAGSTAARNACCVPLVSGQSFLGALYLDGPADAFSPDSSDLMFLGGLASALAVARDRALLADEQRRRAEEQRRLLESELEQLRRSLQESRLLHKSSAMDEVLAVVRRVAPTDATVLVTGESGTGKELLARTIHALSPRRKGPFVVVDCGALPPTLMESELFGHERGAFTGADARRAGRLVEAERGTVVLDEIGELPLDLQSKLLRFVQDRHVTPVGGRPRPLDARLIAATHRDLRADVAAGRFRQDLFYRLNVVHLELPPLRHRPDDVLHLAEHYLERYALLYGRPVRRLSAEAEAEALRHSWPGNVRELQNRIMQAVILCEGEEIGPLDLLGRPGPAVAVAAPAAGVAAPPPTAAPLAPRLFEAAGPEDGPRGAEDRLWAALRQSLSRALDQALSLGATAAPPLGRWLEHDLVLAAHAEANGVLRRAAALAGLPEATLRRRYEQAAHAVSSGLEQRAPGWEDVRARLRELVGTPAAAEPSRLDRLADELLELVESRTPGDERWRCALIGVTPPTYRRRAAALATRPAATR